MPLRLLDAMPLLTKYVFGARGHQRSNLDGFIYTRHAAPPYSADISAIYIPFGKVCSVSFADLRERSLAMK